MAINGIAEEYDLSELENASSPELSKGQKMADAKAAIVGSTPLIPEAPNCIVNLPRGLYRGGSWKCEAEVRELTGADEEALARVRETSDFFDTVLAHGVVRIEDIGLDSLSIPERQAILHDLLIGERSQLLLGILVATYGDEKLLNVTCPHCDVDQEVTIIPSEDFKPKVVENITTTIFNYVTNKGHNVEYRLVTGADQSEVMKKKGASTAEQNTIILSRCITRVNGQLLPDPISYARKLGMKDRTALLTEMVSKQPDLDMSVQMACVGCGGDIVLGLGWADLFRS